MRRRALGACAALCLLASVGAADDTAAPGLPRVRSIVIEPKPVFSSEERLDDIPFLPDLTFIFDLANFLHMDTKEEVIRRELLVEEGDPADPLRIAESERKLRALPYIRQVKIISVPAGDGQVDLEVLAQDTWTTQPRASFGVGGGTRRATFGIIETNLFGYGKDIRLLYRKDIDRTSSLFQYGDPRVLGSRWAASANYQYASDGHVAEGAVHYPFFSLDTPWSGGVGYSSRRERDKVFDHFGNEITSFRRSLEALGVRAGHRVASLSDDQVVWRTGLYYQRSDEAFSGLQQGSAPGLLPDDRLESQPGVFLHREEVRFVRESHLNLFDRIEDLNVGNILDASAGYSWRELGALVDEPILRVSVRQGFDFGPGRKAFVYGLVTGRYADSDVRNAVAEIELVGYHRWKLLLEHTMVARLKLDLARNLDGDTQLFLGNFNGLRGFNTRQFVGQKRFVFNLENRLFFVNDLFHLVSLGAVVFFDSGYVWDQNQPVSIHPIATSAGIGLRIDAPRGSGEALFRLDLGVPITDGGSGHHGPAITLGSGQAFETFVGPFDLQSTSGP